MQSLGVCSVFRRLKRCYHLRWQGSLLRSYSLLAVRYGKYFKPVARIAFTIGCCIGHIRTQGNLAIVVIWWFGNWEIKRQTPNLNLPIIIRTAPLVAAGLGVCPTGLYVASQVHVAHCWLQQGIVENLAGMGLGASSNHSESESEFRIFCTALSRSARGGSMQSSLLTLCKLWAESKCEFNGCWVRV